MKIEVTGLFNNQVSGWKRNIDFTYNGDTYGVLLECDEHNGYDLNYWEVNGEHTYKQPDWVKDYRSVNLEGESGLFALCFDLDDMTCDMKVDA